MGFDSLSHQLLARPAESQPLICRMSETDKSKNLVCLVMPTLLGPLPAALVALEDVRTSLERDHGIATEIWIIDNGGVVAGSAGVRVADPGTNLGFGRAVNWWVREHGAACSTIVLWNDDLAFQHGDDVTPAACAEHVAAWHGRGVAGAIVVSARRDVLLSPGRIDALVGLAGVGRASPIVALRRRAGVPVPAAMAWVLPHAEFETLGGFDESYPLYYEDTDYVLRRAKAGLKPLEVRELPDLIHLHSRTTKAVDDQSAVVAVTAYSTALWLRRTCAVPARVTGVLVAGALVLRLIVDLARRRPTGVTISLIGQHMLGRVDEPALPARPLKGHPNAEGG